MSLWRSFKTTQGRRQRLLTFVFTSLIAMQCEQLDSEAATQCTKRANSMSLDAVFPSLVWTRLWLFMVLCSTRLKKQHHRVHEKGNI